MLYASSVAVTHRTLETVDLVIIGIYFAIVFGIIGAILGAILGLIPVIGPGVAAAVSSAFGFGAGVTLYRSVKGA